MDDKNNKKKESIDDILSDLNGLLNKMPSILDGIKMPEMQPVDSLKPLPEPGPEPAPQAPGPEAGNEAPAGPAAPQLTPAPAEPAVPERTPSPAEPFDAEKTVVLESFAGLPEGSQAPGEVPYSSEPAPAQPQPEASSPAEPEQGETAPAQEKLDVQSLGDFMFGQEAEPEKPAPAEPVKLFGTPLEPPAEEPVRNIASGPSLSVSEFTPPVPEEEAPAAEVPTAEVPTAEVPTAEVPAAEAPAAIPEADLPGIPEPGPDQMVFSPEGEAGPSAVQPPAEAVSDESGPGKQASFEASRDLGIPDIDALLQISEGEKPAAEQPAQPPSGEGTIPESVQAAEAGLDGLSGPAPEEPRPAEETPAAEAPEAAPAAEPGEFIIEPEPKQETPFEAFTIEPSSSELSPAQDGGETLRLEPVPASPEPGNPEQQPAEPEGLQFEPFAEAAPEPVLQAGPEAPAENPAEPAAEPGPEVGGGIQFGSPAGPGSEPGLEAGEGIQPGSPAGPEAEPRLEVGQGIQLGSGPEPAGGSGIELAPGIELGAGAPAPSADPDETLPGITPGQTASGEETLVVVPPPESSGEEEKTVIFQASPDTTTRAQAKDLGTLSARQPPEGVPAERLRSMAFLYSPGDEALCATVLSELDAICLRSASKPMFIKRALVKPCDVDSNANFVHQSVVDSGAIGLVCVGAVPQEKLYEIESAFTSSGGFFRHFDVSSFTHSSALDLVADLIVR
ncbi:MAG: hypothetical protein HY550_07400 [Elusimicrobia bacterium]|nr:hypothetical protein [Elusimicrobiota bacterium]